MAKDPAFLFYPGDYLRDTQCLSEKTQVAYDRIMCEHMRNICISQQQLNFFTKKLNEDEKTELLMTLKKVNGGFQIEWVAESICKRKDYSESRRKNKLGKGKNICKSYDLHMENENEIVNESKNKELSKDEITNTIEFVQITGQKKFNENQVKEFYTAFCINNKNHLNREDKLTHFRNWLKKQDNGTAKESIGKSIVFD
jgi:hypothetical protein